MGDPYGFFNRQYCYLENWVTAYRYNAEVNYRSKMWNYFDFLMFLK